ncbi:DUF4115 domain-containing protein [Rhodobacteraceae bacterium WD3A24]|nr:DUF4115 domain-containing protein [Rhodobacteraceae bacterium WD3A24]
MIRWKAQPSDEEVETPRGFDDYDLRLGDLMRGERATIGKSLLDVQRELKIRASHISAIENCDVAAFDTPGFIAGYVRSYARYLGMDPEWAYAKFCEEADFSTSHGMSPSALGSRRAPAQPAAAAAAKPDPFARPNPVFTPPAEPFWARIDPAALGSMAVLIALIGGVGYGGWSVLQEIQRVRLTPVAESPGVVDELDPLPGTDALSATGSEAENGDNRVAQAPRMPGSDGFERLYRPEALEVPVVTPRDGPIAAIEPRESDTVVARTASAPSPEDLAGTAPAGPAGASDRDTRSAIDAAVAAARQAAEDPAPVRVTEEPPQVAVLAVRPAWVRVRAADGTVLFEKILEAGESYDVPQTEEPATLRAGNSGSVYFMIDGEAYGPSAPGAQIARNVTLSPGALRDSYATADLDADPALAEAVSVAQAGE